MAFVHRQLFKGILLGVAVTIAMSLALAVWMQQTNRIIVVGVGPWITNAVKAEFVGLAVSLSDRVFAEFEYSAENMIDVDYSLPARADAAFLLVSGGKGLNHQEGLIWPSGEYLPPKKKVIVKFTIPFDFTEAFTSNDKDDKAKLAAFMARRLKEIDGFVVLDRQTRYEIAFPMKLREIKLGGSTASK